MLNSHIVYQVSGEQLKELISEVRETVIEEMKEKGWEKPLTKKQAAKFLSISEGRMDVKFREGQLPLKLRHTGTGTIYFFASELESFIKKG